ncbi:hypothetical protein [Paraburkholderia saeva]|uniref:Uncharacterized protein n=1 Tax=Paraburkholderia saeva TaxID=2777537 RepID=A0A9N8X2D4_9BURK|nr:hypothetical protein [Paraburkholderia saeva]CAG4900637.1 hypothetical protein LMG31841_02900 [Paraburkholderia saeva]
MTEPTSDFCAAYGCPMLGVYGFSGKWYCCCHFNANPALNDAITAELHRMKSVVDRVVLARREHRADAQLENSLVLITREIGQQQTIPTSNVTGPTHAAPHFSETDA